MSLEIYQGNDSRASGRDYIEVMHIYNSFKIKPLKNYNKDINVQKVFMNRHVKIPLLFLSFLMYFYILYALYRAFSLEQVFFTEHFSSKENSILIFIFLISYFIIFTLIKLFFDAIVTFKLRILRDRLVLTSKSYKSKTIKFENIRRFKLEKPILGLGSTKFFVYKVDEIQPTFSFSISCSHTVLAVEELLKYIQMNEINKNKKTSQLIEKIEGFDSKLQEEIYPILEEVINEFKNKNNNI